MKAQVHSLVDGNSRGQGMSPKGGTHGTLFCWVLFRMQKVALRQDYSIVGGWYLRLTGQRKDKYL